MTVIKNSRFRNFIKVSVPFFFIPALVISGAVIFDRKRHIIVSLGTAFLSLLLFYSGFEKRTTGTRRMVLVSIMTALCLIGRLLPVLKPVTALVIISGLWLGGEAGFLVGSLSALISNFYFGQGPWTPFQMLALGIIGLFAGILEKPLKKSRFLIILCGFISGAAYSFIMDIWTVLWYAEGFSMELYSSALVTAIPYTISYAAANVIFLWLLEKPFSEKFYRIKIKYGI